MSTLLENLRLSEANQRNYEVLLYIDILMKFYVTSLKQIQKRDYSPCYYSEVASLDILQKFTVSSKTSRYVKIQVSLYNTLSSRVNVKKCNWFFRMRPSSLKDKCVCYLLVLCITLNGYKLDLEIFSKDIKIGLKKLHEMSRVLAFSIVDANKAALKLPLPTPLSLIKQGKGKKR